jgi:hypothetical protein
MKSKLRFGRFPSPAVNGALMLVIVSIVIAASIIDTSIVKLSVFTGNFTSTLNIVVFSVLVAIYAVGQHIILLFIKRKINLNKIPPLNTIHKIVSIIQYFLISVFIIIIAQMIFASYYNLFLLKLSVCISYGLSVFLLAFLAKKFFSWFRSNHDIIVISYALSVGILSVNAVFTILTVMYGLIGQQEEIRPLSSPVSIVTNADNIFNSIYVESSILSFIFIWIATALLLRYYSKKFGTAKYWIIISVPLFYFLSQFQDIFIDLFAPFRLSDPILFGIVFTLVFNMAKPIGGILFGLAFWIISKRISQHTIKDYLRIAAYGTVLLFTSYQAIDLIVAPYPPFGLVTVSFIGLSSYMLLIGIYSSAMSISKDSELRKFIGTIAVKESKLLDSIGFAQIEQELIMKITPLIRRQAQNIEEETGIMPSLTDKDVKKYLDDVLLEIRKNNKK